MLVHIRMGPMPGDEAWVVLNPFRDRTPERQAEALLSSLKNGKCAEALAAIVKAPELEAVCEREHRWPLASWELEQRDDGSAGTRLEYRYVRGPRAAEQWLYVWLVRDGNQWRVTEYRSVY
jgi:hypothetical protein